MKYAQILILGLAASSCALAQDTLKPNVVYQSGGASGVAIAASVKMFGAPIQGAPYSANITNESIQTLADGNRIVQTSSGTTARDSQGRTRQDAMLPAIGNLSASDAPHIVFIMDPVAQVSYTLNLVDKTAQKLSMPPAGPGPGEAGTISSARIFATQPVTASVSAGQLPPPPLPPPVAVFRSFGSEEQADVSTEDLGSQTMEGLLVNGVRTTRTIPVGEIGNEKPIAIITEVWTSPDLKTIVYSKRTDPRMGEQIFKLTDIVRATPDPSLFAVPQDFKLSDAPQQFIYRPTR
jgi:hypothetical protein